VCVDLGIQPAACMTVWLYKDFAHYVTNDTIFGKSYWT